MNRHSNFERPLSDEAIEKAAALWNAGRDSERLAVQFGRHESVIYNALPKIRAAAREQRIQPVASWRSAV